MKDLEPYYIPVGKIQDGTAADNPESDQQSYSNLPFARYSKTVSRCYDSQPGGNLIVRKDQTVEMESSNIFIDRCPQGDECSQKSGWMQQNTRIGDNQEILQAKRGVKSRRHGCSGIKTSCYLEGLPHPDHLRRTKTPSIVKTPRSISKIDAHLQHIKQKLTSSDDLEFNFTAMQEVRRLFRDQREKSVSDKVTDYPGSWEGQANNILYNRRPDDESCGNTDRQGWSLMPEVGADRTLHRSIDLTAASQYSTMFKDMSDTALVTQTPLSPLACSTPIIKLPLSRHDLQMVPQTPTSLSNLNLDIGLSPIYDQASFWQLNKSAKSVVNTEAIVDGMCLSGPEGSNEMPYGDSPSPIAHHMPISSRCLQTNQQQNHIGYPQGTKPCDAGDQWNRETSDSQDLNFREQQFRDKSIFHQTNHLAKDVDVKKVPKLQDSFHRDDISKSKLLSSHKQAQTAEKMFLNEHLSDECAQYELRMNDTHAINDQHSSGSYNNIRKNSKEENEDRFSCNQQQHTPQLDKSFKSNHNTASKNMPKDSSCNLNESTKACFQPSAKSSDGLPIQSPAQNICIKQDKAVQTDFFNCTCR